MGSFETNRRKEEERIREEDRLPPGQSLTLKFPVLHYGPVPVFTPSTWDFRIWGEVEEEKSWTWDQFLKLPRTQVNIDLHCVTRWSKADTLWEGVSLRSMVESGLIRIKPNVTHVMQHAEHGYTTNLPLEVFLQDNFLMATHFDGKPLTPDHGYPLRGVIGHIPSRDDLESPYLWKGAKWLRSLEFMTADRLGFWEKGGYHNRADVWNEERFR
ncbi:MAG: sulfite oxidase-like oxidoreductase [Anaerolineales bacterium]|uniref:Sulfite oxidase-like oxidoreductase n=1 Tax=Candidatus Desulfolinea nitratireducens TaxID=2841698 RepID=A0A8J6NNR7_9CHLR|nr:sulfite oxidase-like oxidoreductase [Candidatus Desulfolinea nitratireducens]MBL6959542.1 sulfite oxidase-like oxidoreductase [Anaerolineales bacterium]